MSDNLSDPAVTSTGAGESIPESVPSSDCPAETSDAPSPTHSTKRLIEYRRRAMAAEQQLEELQKELEQTRQTVNRLDRRQKIDSLLTDSQTVDLEAARLLTEAAVEMMSEPDIRLAIEDLRRQKPYLFRRRAGESGPVAQAMSRRTIGQDEAADIQLEQAAEQAMRTGDRRDLLRYLRLRPPCPPRNPRK